MKCNKCGKDNPANAKFCNHCGAKLENEGKTCPNPQCGRSGLPQEAQFCPDCGFELATEKEYTNSSVYELYENTNNNFSDEPFRITNNEISSERSIDINNDTSDE